MTANVIKIKSLICLLFGIIAINLQTDLFGYWSSINSPAGGTVYNIISGQNEIYANAFNSGIYKSTNNGAHWNRITPPNHPLRLCEYMLVHNNVIIASAMNWGIFISTDRGASWINTHNGIIDGSRYNVNKMKIQGSEVLLLTTEGILSSFDSGNSWVQLPLGTIDKNIIDYEEHENFIYLINNEALFVTDKGSTNWKQLKINDFQNIQYYRLFNIKDELYFCMFDSLASNGFYYNIYKKSVGSEDINPYREDIFMNNRVIGLDISSSLVSVSTVIPLSDRLEYHISVSSDNGENWNMVYDSTFRHRQHLTSGLTRILNYVFVGSFEDGIIRINTTNSQKEVQVQDIHNLHVNNMLIKGSEYFVGTSNNGIFYSSNSGGSWKLLENSPKNNPEEFSSIFKIIYNDDNLFAATNNGLHISYDNGNSWNLSSWSSYVIIDVISESGVLYALGNLISGSLFISNDNGGSWAARQLPSEALALGFLKDGDVFYVLCDIGIYKTNNNGLNWELIYDGVPPVNVVQSIIKSGLNIIAGAADGIHISTDNGVSWSKQDNIFTDEFIIRLHKSGNYVFCSTESGAYISFDSGLSWENVNNGLGNLPVQGFTSSVNEVFALCSRDKIYKADLKDLSKIIIENISGDIFCSGMEIPISYVVASDADFQDDNKFMVELSDENGNFNSQRTIIGEIISKTSGVINVLIPDGLPFGTKYRIRIVSTSPRLVSIDNLYNIIMLQKSVPVIDGSNQVCSMSEEVYSVPVNPGFSYEWFVSGGEIISELGNPEITVRWSELGAGSLKVIQRSIASCSDSNSFSVVINPKPDRPIISESNGILYAEAEGQFHWYKDGLLIDDANSSEYQPDADGIYTVRVINEFLCPSDLSEPYNFVKFEDRIVFNIDDITAMDGEEIFINIRLVKNRKYYETGVKSIKAVIVFNASLLYPNGPDKGIIIDGKRYIQIDIDTNYISDDIVKVMSFTSMLGNSISTDVTLENVRINDISEPAVLINAGLFSLFDICFEGGPRLVTASNPPSIESISPNPASSSMSFKIYTENSADAEIHLVNRLGIRERIIFEGKVNSGYTEFTLDIGDLLTGDYYLLLNTMGYFTMNKLIIAR